jgi:CHAT domain-containing protein/tetratricopeptide (TPR) repeat protein
MKRIPFKWILMACLVSGALLPASLAAQALPPPMPKPVEELLERALDLKYKGQHEEALRVAQEAVELGRKTDGLTPGALARLMDEVGEIQIRLGRHGEAEATCRRALEIRERAGNLDDPGIAWTLNGLATSLIGQGRFADAEPLLKRALALLDAVADPEESELALVMFNLSVTYIGLGKSEESEAITRRIFELNRTLMEELDPQSPESGTKPETAPESMETLVQKQLEMNRRLLEQDDETPFETRFNLEAVTGYLAEEEKRFEDAKNAYQRAVELAVAERGASSPEAGCAWNALAGLERKLGRLTEAEELYRKAAGVFEPRRKTHPLDLAFSWTGLARLAAAAGHPREAREWHERALEAWTEALGEHHTLVANALYELASLPEEAGLPGPDRERFLRKARSLYDDLLSPVFSRQDLESLRVMMESVGRSQEASDCAGRISRQWAESLPASEMVSANQLRQTAQQHTLWYGGYSQAVPLLLRAVELRRTALGGEHPMIVDDLRELAAAELGAKQIPAGLRHAREAAALLDRTLEARQDPREALQEQTFRRGVFLTHLDLLFAAGQGPLLRGELAEESFAVGQRARASGTALTLEAAVARFGAGDAELSGLARRFQDSAARIREIDEDLLEAAGRPSKGRDLASEAALRGERETLAESLARLRSDLTRRYPTYADLVFPRPVPLARVRELLGPREALLAYVAGPRWTYAWLVRGDRVEARRLPLRRDDLGLRVSSLRRSLDVAQVRLQMQRGQIVPDFDFGTAAFLYRELVLPFRSGLTGVHHLFLVPDGPLESLPFGVLVADEPAAIKPGEALATARWLVRDLATSVVPAVSSLSALRRMREASRARRSFAGFGQPRSPETPAASAGAEPDSPRSRLQRMRALRRLSDLQETRNELAGIGSALGGTPEDLRFGDAVTEAAVRRFPLADYRVVAFATHALLAGEAGAAEPSLVLAPAGEGDDGRLTAREIMDLEMDAELVLLLGCNTAAADGTPEAEGLSGLARAFFHAGSRALLVSHWAVPSEETVVLATGAFAQLRDSEASLAEALRRSMLRMIDEPERPELAHPVFWGAFVLVGDGTKRPVTSRADSREVPALTPDR